MKVANRAKLNRLIGKIEEIKATVEEVRDAEQEAFDNKSDKWRESDKGQQVESDLGQLDECITNLEAAFDNLNALPEA